MIMQPLRRRAAALFAFALAACSATHEIEKADTATSWLRACVQDDECDGVGRCLNHVCTLPCSEDRSCGTMAAGARCEAIEGEADRTCTLGCTRAADCAVLDGQFECQERTCRPRSMLDMSTQALVLEPPVATPASWTVMSPVVTWAGDRWRLGIVAHTDDERSGNLPRVLGTAEIDRAGTSTTSAASASQPETPDGWDGAIRGWLHALAIDGTVVMRIESSSRSPFAEPTFEEKQAFQFLLPDGSPPRSIECLGSMDALELPQIGEWLVLCEQTDAAVSLGRYDPRTDAWSVALRPLPSGWEGATLALQGDDLLLYRDDETDAAWVARIPGGARAEVRELPGELRWQKIDGSLLRTGEGYLSSGGPSGGWVVPSWFQQSGIDSPTFVSLWGVPLAQAQEPTGFLVKEDGTVSEPVRFRLSSAERMSLFAVQGLGESRRIAFCYEERHRAADGVDRMDLLLSVFDSEGTRIAGPTRIASSPRAMSACQLSWSGSALLATWFEDPASREVSSTPFARVIPVR